MDWVAMKTQAITFVTVYGLKILSAILILVIGRYVANVAGRLVKKAMNATQTGDTLATFVGNMAYFGIMIFVVIAAISKLGVQTTSFVAIIGASGLAIGLALQGSLSNFAAGVMIIIFHPFKVGDQITAGAISGTIYDIQIFSSVVLTPDNKRIIVPNAKLTSDAIVNFTAMPTRRVDMSFTVIAPDEQTARRMIKEIIDQDERVLKTPAANIYLVEALEYSFTYNVQPHVNTADYSKTMNSITEQVKLAFYELSKSIPEIMQRYHDSQQS